MLSLLSDLVRWISFKIKKSSVNLKMIQKTSKNPQMIKSKYSKLRQNYLIINQSHQMEIEVGDGAM